MRRRIAEQTKLKNLLKAAVVEILEERPDLVRDALADAIEDHRVGITVSGNARAAPAATSSI